MWITKWNDFSHNTSTILMSTTTLPWSTAASSPQLSCKIPDSFSGSEATITDDIFFQQNQKLFLLGVVYKEQHPIVHKIVSVMPIKQWDLKQQPTYQVGLILSMRKKVQFSGNSWCSCWALWSPKTFNIPKNIYYLNM